MSEHTADVGEQPDRDYSDGGRMVATDLDALPADLRDALGSLDELRDLPLTEHVDRYQRIHSGLQSALSDIEGV
jgi:hypothetical protein